MSLRKGIFLEFVEILIRALPIWSTLSSGCSRRLMFRSRPFSLPTLLLVQLGVLFSFTMGAENVVVQPRRGIGHLHSLDYVGLGGENLREDIILAPTENERGQKVFELVISCERG